MACAAGDGAVTPAPDVPGDGAKDAAVDGLEDTTHGTSDAAPDVSARCGDGVCTRGVETCMNCPLDCNRCPTCDMAPSCTGALAVPLMTSRVADCDNTMGSTQRTNYVCGASLGVAPAATTCADPRLRIRVRDISIQRGFFDVPRNLYCVISAEDGAHAELLLISPRQVAGNRNTTTINLRPSEGLLWGQGDLYRSIANVTITYGCFLASDGATAQRVLDQIAGRAGMAARHADGYGWVFGTASVVATILGSALGTVRDSQIADVQQTIAAGALLTLTNGRSWEIRVRRGDLALSGASDLRLNLEAWGCSEVRSVAP
jgi:hypothetical protein